MRTLLCFRTGPPISLPQNFWDCPCEIFICRIPFLSFIRWCQSTERIISSSIIRYVQTRPSPTGVNFRRKKNWTPRVPPFRYGSNIGPILANDNIGPTLANVSIQYWSNIVTNIGPTLGKNTGPISCVTWVHIYPRIIFMAERNLQPF